MVEHDDYMPEFGTLVVRDFPGGSGVDQRDVGPLAEYATDAQPCGPIARAGYGWLEAAAGDGSHLGRLEHHDSAPLIDS